jgi:hypothetical protein
MRLVMTRLSGLVPMLFAASAASAQQRLLDVRSLSSGVVAEQWNFGSASPTGGAGSVVSASQFTVPFTAIVPIVSNWAFDTYVAYAHGAVTVDRGGSEGRQQLSLSGLNDAKVRLVGKLHGDNVLVTLGASLPSGTTALDPSQLEALSVLAAPALRFRTPTLGNGPTGTGGLVLAGQSGSWSYAFGGAYERRGDYAPAEALTAGLGRPALKAGDAVHLSVGADRILENARQSISLIADVYTNGELRDPSAPVALVNFKLGPTITGTYQVQATINNVESMLYIIERFRANYSVGGTTVEGSRRNESEIGFVNAIPLNPQLSFRVGVDSRFHTASGVATQDQTVAGFATAGILAGGATLGLQYAAGGAGGSFVLEPFVRAQVGRLDLGGPTRQATGISAGLTLTTRF